MEGLIVMSMEKISFRARSSTRLLRMTIFREMIRSASVRLSFWFTSC